MSFDAHKNLAISTVKTAPSPATSGTSLGVTTGEGGRFPAPPFNATVWPASQPPTPTNAELVRVTAIAGDGLTITRAVEGSTARAIVAGDLLAATVTVKCLTDIEVGTNFPNLSTTGAITGGGNLTLPSGAIIHLAATVVGQAFTEIATGAVSLGNTGTAIVAAAAFYNASGQVGTITTSGTATAYNTTSDARLKTDRGLITDPEVLRHTKIHHFTWNTDGTVGRGVFAQEAITVAPFAVSVGTDERDESGNLKHPWGVDYSKYVPDLIAGWQQHDQWFDHLTARVAALERGVTTLTTTPPIKTEWVIVPDTGSPSMFRRLVDWVRDRVTVWPKAARL